MKSGMTFMPVEASSFAYVLIS